MDAVPLIEDTRRALAHSKEAADVLTEAWQAQALAEAVGAHLVTAGPPEVRTQAGGLCEAGGRACGSLRGAGHPADGARAAGMTEIRDLLAALRDLCGLLDETGGALVRLAVDAEEGTYWRCIEGIDAADECGDRAMAIIRRLARCGRRLRRAPPPGDAIRAAARQEG
ncbi:DUF6099 family protein [Streptomyces taklimakanensis]|uniref:DUF6099 family protein n=1 Tax=Streptomyces taklimakanensis TaxID=2569853 RepID=UPI001EE3CE4C|nr:DUF6099 family protein [Streptomyces taklimakanensis]